MNSIFRNIQKGKRNFSIHTKGFTLPELLVVIFIIALITALALANYKSYSNDAALANTVYDLALTMRQTQLYGISVKESTQGSGQFQNAYGIHFSSDSSSYTIYQDNIFPLNYFYDNSSGNELVSQNKLPQGISFLKFCTVVDGAKNCANADNTSSTFIDLEFVRPNPDTNITAKVPLSASPAVTYTPSTNPSDTYGACIYLTTTSGKTRFVYIDKTGQISVNATQCSN